MADPYCGLQTSGHPIGVLQGAPKIPSLTEDMGDILRRLPALLVRVQIIADKLIADKLNGGSPRPVEENAKPAEPPSMCRQIDIARAMLGKIEDEVQTIDVRL